MYKTLGGHDEKGQSTTMISKNQLISPATCLFTKHKSTNLVNITAEGELHMTKHSKSR